MDCNVTGDMVSNFYKKPITLSSDNTWTWKFSLDRNHAFCVAQSCHVLQLDLHEKIDQLVGLQIKMISIICNETYVKLIAPGSSTNCIQRKQ